MARSRGAATHRHNSRFVVTAASSRLRMSKRPPKSRKHRQIRTRRTRQSYRRRRHHHRRLLCRRRTLESAGRCYREADFEAGRPLGDEGLPAATLAAARTETASKKIRAISAVGIFMNDAAVSGAALFRLYSLRGRSRPRGQKACFTKQEIRADERPSRDRDRVRKRGEGGRKGQRNGGGRGVENEPKERSPGVKRRRPCFN